MTDKSCSKSKCLSCVGDDGCGWCNDGLSEIEGECVLSEQGCSGVLLTESNQCPSVGADVIIKNISGMVGAMLAIAILLNVCNRLSNRRKSRNLRKSIFTLPVYVYSASTRERAKASREARAASQAVADTLHDIEHATSDRSSTSSASSALSSSSSSAVAAAAGTASPGSRSPADDGDIAATPTCTICLAPYEEEEVIKVLPCNHDFHAGCLDSWLKLKAICPLCKEPPFAKSGDRNWTSQRQQQIHEPGATTAAPPLLRSTSNSPSRPQSSPLDGGVRPRGEGLLLVRASPPPTPPPAEPRAAATGVCGSVGADGTQERRAFAAAGERTRLPGEGVGEETVQSTGDEGPRAEAETRRDAANVVVVVAAERSVVDGAPVASAVVGSTRDGGAATGGVGVGIFCQ